MSGEFYRIVTKELAAIGFAIKPGGKGSHEKWCGGAADITLIVPQNLKSRHTANAILKDAGSDKRV